MKTYTYAVKKSKNIHLWIIESYWLKFFENSGYTPRDIKINFDNLTITMEIGISLVKLNKINNYNLIKDLDNAINFLHDNFVVHGDIKPDNIIKCRKVFKLIDFDNANIIGNYYNNAYTDGFRHPDFDYIADTKYDWWSAAASLYFIWRGDFLTTTNRNKLKKVIRNKSETPLIVTKILEWSAAKSNKKKVIEPIDNYDKFLIYNELCGIFLNEQIIKNHKKNIIKILNNPFKYPVFRTEQECVLNQHTLISALERINDRQIY